MWDMSWRYGVDRRTRLGGTRLRKLWWATSMVLLLQGKISPHAMSKNMFLFNGQWYTSPNMWCTWNLYEDPVNKYECPSNDCVHCQYLTYYSRTPVQVATQYIILPIRKHWTVHLILLLDQCCFNYIQMTVILPGRSLAVLDSKSISWL